MKSSLFTLSALPVLMTHTTTFDGQNRLGLYTCSGHPFASTTAVFESVLLKQ